jgi:uncharacterized membrane protein YphA (DoxX/SURF4 family)
MTSLFPELLTYSLIAPLLLRLTIAMVFIFWAYRMARMVGRTQKDVLMSVVYGISGLLFLVGIFTQFASLVAVVVLGVHIIKKIMSRAFLTDGVNYYLILLAIAISLLFTGPGFFAFDLPF